MQRNFIFCDPEKCTGCGICELVCSAVKDGAFNPLLSRIRMVRTEPFFLINMSIACRLCEDPKCVRSCPKKALRADEETRVIIVDEDRCDGCSWCVQACEFGAMILHMDNKRVVACDLCGLDPKCVYYCPKEALALMTTEEIGQKLRRRAVKKLLAEAL